ncbi:hypothetical protein [Prevotella sp.]|uniref:hypothetical protein n=1 Tax=Prevotella sp. TaxID=59823 RepID=UPI00266F0215
MRVKEKYIAALNDEQAKMVSYVKQMTAKVAFPEAAITTTYTKPAKHTVASAACLVGGAVTMAAGLCLEKNGISTAGGVAVACGAGLWAIDRNKKPVVQRDVAFYKVTNHYYKSLSDIFKYVTNSWTDSLVELKSKLKAEIMQQNISEEEKNSAIQSVLTTSVVDMSMADDVSSKLSKLEHDHDEEGYKRFVSIFEKKCIEAINTAYEEQKAVYERLQF